ncbi:MAG: phosphoglycerate kinase [Eubacteriales bacterium]
MNYKKKSVKDVDVKGKKVLLRCDFNVPQDKETGAITDDKRIRAALPTIEYLLEQGATVIACSHLGKPKGEWKPALSLAPVAERLSSLLGKPVAFCKDIIGEDATNKVAEAKAGEIVLLENLRYDNGETKNDPAFAKALASFADLYVSDAFGTVHRAHASTEGVSKFLPAVSGFLIAKELEIMGGAIAAPKKPLVAILGGAKVSDKIAVIENLLNIADTIIIGGGMAYTFKKAQGFTIGTSLCEDDRVDYAKDMLVKAKEKGVNLLIPCDAICGDSFSKDATPVKAGDDIPDGLMGLDVGEKTIAEFTKAIESAGTVLWNGPMGVFEFPNFATGTKAIGDALAKCNAITIVGGGDTAAAAEQFGVAEKMSHVSTGGGASLELLEGKVLPGVACLQDA